MIEASYSQIAVFNSHLENPFNNWTEQHIAQGFSWRDESVSFHLLIEAGPISVEAIVAEKMPTVNAARAISVPFNCQSGSAIEIASITDGKVTDIPAGEYQLLFETGCNEILNWSRFTFIRQGSMLPKIIIPGTLLTTTNTFLMQADPA